jgi:hypothetical protein
MSRLIASALIVLLAPTIATAGGAAPTPGQSATAVERPTTLAELMRSMANTPGVAAEFTETKHIALLEAPLETTGTLYFIPPDRMARYTTHPGKSTLIIDGDRLVFDDESGGDRIDLATNTVARVFVANFIVLFNGDLGELQRRYEPTFAIDGDQWSLVLVPRAEVLAKMIASITLRGDDDGMRSMVLREPGGDFTETRFDSLDTKRVFADDEIDRLLRRGEPAAP